ncbi:putative RNA-directed DNA polymerase [Lupinus albus]|uniref:Putative RNA-directed DNA polymerase n=1 Tax=Lupinus albus TaxID=3870 RepID=A0A6A4PKG9_LUPAL|nr:putative RNA-directed DNA polymerase [Lupinus albus]
MVRGLLVLMGEDICNSVGQFFRESWLLPNLNSNNIILIPKHAGADRIDEFKPIALANFQFKIISKILASRLTVIAPNIVSSQQRGFLKERHIQDCICIASEAINLLDYKSFGGNLAIKLDIKKAFDTLDWNFLQDTLKAFGFSSKFVHWVKVILYSAKLSINVNGENVGFFNYLRGVRQGDPLSPLFFCLAEDVFSRGLSKLVSERRLIPIDGPCGIQTPTHVLYADDILIFCKGLKVNLLALNSLTQEYAQASGQLVNLVKCKFYTCSASDRKISNLSATLGFHAGSLPFTYLGVPLFKGKPRRLHLQPISDRIVAKLATWKCISLSIMGRVELVQSVIHSMLAYSFHIYAWPSSLLKT